MGCDQAIPDWLALLKRPGQELSWESSETLGAIKDSASRTYLQQRFQERNWQEIGILRAATERIGHDQVWAAWLRGALPTMRLPEEPHLKWFWGRLLAALARQLHLHIVRQGDFVQITDRR